MGIKVSWTLSSDYIWDKTHKFASYIWILSGILMIFNSVIRNLVVLIILVLIMTIIPIIYAYFLSKKQIIQDK
ncbi:MAG: SdpI family protein [Lachnospiraceae bacterium]|nr:SdpI family protein [Lachnospiraceae bacterium]